MRVMVIGASADRGKFGNIAVRTYLAQGHEVLPVNPKGGEIEGVRVFPSIGDVPGAIDRASLYLPAEPGKEAVRALSARGDVGEVWLNPGADDAEVVAEASRLGLTVIRACSIAAIGASA